METQRTVVVAGDEQQHKSLSAPVLIGKHRLLVAIAGLIDGEAPSDE